jgi:hypothetical protein
MDIKKKKEQETQEILSARCRMYENKFPAPDDLVMVILYFIQVFNHRDLRRRSIC